MSWLIFVHLYLVRSSLRRWLEQPLSVLSKLLISALTGAISLFVILGIQELGRQLEKRLSDRTALIAVVGEIFPTEDALERLEQLDLEGTPWKNFSSDVDVYLQGGGTAQVKNFGKIPIYGIEKMESLGLVDDFFIVSANLPVGKVFEFTIGENTSEAAVIAGNEDIAFLSKGRNVLIGSNERLGLLFTRGFSETTLLKAKSIDELRKAESISNTLQQVEDRDVFFSSNLRLLSEIEKISVIQNQALSIVSLGSSIVLGLIFGSLAWMEFREEQYLLALLRSFGVEKTSLILHSMLENCVVAVVGVLIGFVVLRVSAGALDLRSLNVEWIATDRSVFQREAVLLVCGAAFGGVLSIIPVAIGLRKPLGLVLT